jgi:hypothetical protein
VIVVTNLNNINGGNADSTFYTIHIEQNHQTPDAFPATSEPPEVGFGSYKVIHKAKNAFINLNTAHVQYSEGCSGVIHPEETKSCTIDILYNPQIQNP